MNKKPLLKIPLGELSVISVVAMMQQLQIYQKDAFKHLHMSCSSKNPELKDKYLLMFKSEQDIANSYRIRLEVIKSAAFKYNLKIKEAWYVDFPFMHDQY